VAQGVGFREIRLLNTTGIAGHVFQTGEGLIIDDAYTDPRFNRTVDADTGFVTRNLICAPIVTPGREVIGVLQVLNKRLGTFTRDDLDLLESMTAQTSMTLRSAQVMERMLVARQEELKFLDLVSEITSDMDLGTMLAKVVNEAAKMLQADRATLFPERREKERAFLARGHGRVGGRDSSAQHSGNCGRRITTGQAINIPYAYADLRSIRDSISAPDTSRAPFCAFP